MWPKRNSSYLKERLDDFREPDGDLLIGRRIAKISSRDGEIRPVIGTFLPYAALAPFASRIDEHLHLLGLKNGATREDVRRAYRLNAMQCHPDRFATASARDRSNAAESMRRLNEAYETLMGEL